MANITITIPISGEASTTVTSASTGAAPSPMSLEKLQGAVTGETAAPPPSDTVEAGTAQAAAGAPQPLPIEQLQAATTGEGGGPPAPELDPEEEAEASSDKASKGGKKKSKGKK